MQPCANRFMNFYHIFCIGNSSCAPLSPYNVAFGLTMVSVTNLASNVGCNDTLEDSGLPIEGEMGGSFNPEYRLCACANQFWIVLHVGFSSYRPLCPCSHKEPRVKAKKYIAQIH
ncbi:hypothetical protein AGOR_G00218560 [Albula goreensis]|uniref:Uncharacterized protein n=1 Tax=Albula goreensis TaxID=1534307 RepID=A0A8T3CJN9_9TELE|nr:hypothetical protein AGOR_G00218560 [Albula goreensis]